MSHLTANPFQRPYEFPRVSPLLTPPDTESEYQNQIPHSTVSGALGIDLEPSSSYRTPSATEVPTPARNRPSLQYIHSGPKEMRERVTQRGSAARWLLVVVPPTSMAQEHGHLGHTLTVGSPNKLTQGILMPLHSTLSNQLGAIAREFGFPSTTGLCLYLQTSYNGSSLSPRISDESWPLLWHHLFEPRSPSLPPSQLPVGGKVEFDIDLKKARWYEAWLGLGRRDVVDVPVSVAPSRQESISHWREDSRTTTILDEHGVPADDQLDEISLRQLPRPSRPPGHRHVPRKLSLLDRLESTSVRSSSKFFSRNQSPPSPTALPETRHPLALSPIVQETSEPATAKKDIDRFVNSWRVSATVTPSPMAATGQTSLDPVNMPNDLPIEDGEASSELNLDDYQWSVSSLGPPDYDEDDDAESWGSWRLPSVHLDRRMEGSVLLSPTTCTSFGPPDWDEDARSYLSYVSRLPSPDLAARMFEDCPPTPSTATSWGPPLSYPPSPSVSSYAPSVDIAGRQIEDCPPTPSTATSWGPASYPPSPVLSELSYTYSVDIGQRCMSEVPLTPSTATSWGPPASWPATPATPYFVHTPDVGQRTFDIDGPPRPLPPRPAPGEVQESEAATWQNVWPYTNAPKTGDQEAVEQSGSAPWQSVWPYNANGTTDGNNGEGSSSTAPAAPQESAEPGPWKSVWPYNSSETPGAESQSAASPYSFVFPRRPTSPSSAAIEASPTIREIAQPKAAAPAVQTPQQSNAPFAMVWPYFNVFKSEAPTAGLTAQPVYREDIVLAPPPRVRKASPFKFVFPEEDNAVASSSSSHAAHATPVPVDPHGARWKEVWPYNRAKSPAIQEEDEEEEVSEKRSSPSAVIVRLQPAYPVMQLYAPVYPHLDIYPAIPGKAEKPLDPTCYPGSVYNIYPAVSRSRSSLRAGGLNVKLTAAYPNLELYPAVYPYNLENIYPSTKAQDIYRRVDVQLKPSYPVMEIYTPVYPYNLASIYPPVSISERSETKDPIIVLRSPWPYPALDIYPAVYPWNMESIYPRPAAASKDTNQVLSLPMVYPNIIIYSPVYPYNLDFIYPATSLAKHTPIPSVPTRPKVAVPHSAVRTLREHGHVKQRSSIASRGAIPPVPPLPQNVQRLQPISPSSRLPLAGKTGLSLPVQLEGHYPRLCFYPPVYPHLDLYPEIAASAVSKVSVYLQPRYPALNIYRAVYPYLEIYPEATAHRMASKAQSISKAVPPMFQPRRRPTRSHLELREEVLKAVPPPPPAVEVPAFLPRRSPRFSHRELHEQVMMSMPPVAKVQVDNMFSAILEAAELSAPAAPRLPPSPRRLPVPPQISVVPLTDPAVTPSPPPSSTSSSSSPSIRTRIRSGTVSNRPPLPTPPPMGPLPATPTPPHTPPSGSPRIARRLPNVPSDISLAEAQAPARPQSTLVRGVGLPTDPAVIRRASGIGFNRATSFSPLPTVPEPDTLITPVSASSSRSISPNTPLSRPLPQPRGLEPPAQPGLSRSGSESARLPAPSAPMGNLPELSRANSVPGRPLSRIRRGSVANLAKNYDATAPIPEEPTRLSMASLSQFPSVPRPPVPSLPSTTTTSRPVSKLDRSKYPFA